MKHMLTLLAVVLAMAGAGPVRAEAPIVYRVELRTPQTQMVDIRMDVPDVRGPIMEFRLPTWRPGKYTILDPAGSIREVRAADERGGRLPVVKTDKSTWRVETRGATRVSVQYRLYANSLADRTRHVDDTHAFLSGSSVFMYLDDRRNDPLHVVVEAPEQWSVATGLAPDPRAPFTWVAANYDVLVDTPLEIGRHDVLRFDVEGVPHEIVIWPTGVEYDAERLRDDFRSIVTTQMPIFGTLPYDRYVFLIHAGSPYGGTEHLNSTIMQVPRATLEASLAGDRAYQRFLGLVAHEFFHTWNVKQLRPAGIHPYDYQRENYTSLLWVAEGTTSYYDDLTLMRGGLIGVSRYLELIGRAITRFRARPGAAVQSLEASSFDAWIKHSRVTADSVNSTVSFYSKGALVSFVLDAEIRRASGGAASLDDVMRDMYARFPLRGPGYTADDLQAAIEARAGVSFDVFFARYVRGTDPLPLEEAAAVFGLVLERTVTADDDDASDAADGEDADSETTENPKRRAYLGMQLRADGGRTIVRAVLADGPAYAAGIIAGDEIIALDDRRLGAKELDDRLERRVPGDRVTLHVMRRDGLRVFDVVLDEREAGDWTLAQVDEPTAAQRAAWATWAQQPWGDEE